jgi:hypothetical protein
MPPIMSPPQPSGYGKWSKPGRFCLLTIERAKIVEDDSTNPVAFVGIGCDCDLQIRLSHSQL